MPHAATSRPRLSLPVILLLLLLLQTQSVAAADDPYTVSLPNGVTLQLIAVSTSPSFDRPWWKPDGSPVDAPPYEHMGSRPHSDPSQRCYELAVRVTGLPPGEQLQRSVGGGAKYYVNGGARPFVGDRQLDDVLAFFVHISPAETSVTLEMGVGANEWRPVVSFPGPGTYGEGPNRVRVLKPEDGGRRPRAEGAEAPRFFVRMLKTDKSLRLLAVDLDGKTHACTGGQSWGGEDQGVDAIFPGLPPERVKEYRLEACPYHPVVFRDVKLRPSDAEGAAALASKWRARRIMDRESKAGADVAKRLAGPMRVLRSSRTAFEDADAWGRALRDVAEIGPPAAPALLAELNRTARPYVRSNMAIALRLIGDPRAIPGLATALASNPFAPNDYGGLPFKDEKLKQYLARCVSMDHGGASLGRPVNEVTETLVALAMGHSEGDQHRMKNDRALYQEASLRWSLWWDQNRAALLRGLPEQRGAYSAAGEPVDLLASLDGLEQRLAKGPALAAEKVAGEWTRLHAAALFGRLAEASLLTANGAKPDAAAYGWTPLHLAAASGSPDVVNRLLEKGGDVNATTPDGCTALHAALGLGLSPAYTRICTSRRPRSCACCSPAAPT